MHMSVRKDSETPVEGISWSFTDRFDVARKLVYLKPQMTCCGGCTVQAHPQDGEVFV
jgi:hypothetical protein